MRFAAPLSGLACIAGALALLQWAIGAGWWTATPFPLT